LAIIAESGMRIFKEKLPNEIATITDRLSLYSGTLEGVVVESTYNWYWLVDGLMSRFTKFQKVNKQQMFQHGPWTPTAR